MTGIQKSQWDLFAENISNDLDIINQRLRNALGYKSLSPGAPKQLRNSCKAGPSKKIDTQSAGRQAVAEERQSSTDECYTNYHKLPARPNAAAARIFRPKLPSHYPYSVSRDVAPVIKGEGVSNVLYNSANSSEIYHQKSQNGKCRNGCAGNCLAKHEMGSGRPVRLPSGPQLKPKDCQAVEPGKENTVEEDNRHNSQNPTSVDESAGAGESNQSHSPQDHAEDVIRETENSHNIQEKEVAEQQSAPENVVDAPDPGEAETEQDDASGET